MAEQHLRRAADLDPANVQCRQTLVGLLLRDRRPAEAVVIVGQLRKLERENPGHLLSLARLHRQLEQFGPAADALRSALEIAPKDPQALSGLIEIYLTTRQHLPEAVGLARRLVAAQPTAESYFVLFTACLANDKRPEGRAALEEALRLDPDNAAYAQAANLLGME